MKTDEDLRSLLRQIDHRGYPAYKETRGIYQFQGFLLSIDHVQGDPFASPSKVSLIVKGRDAAFAHELYDTDYKKTALEDYILRRAAKLIGKYSFQAKGSGKSGMLSVSRPGQEILKRSACTLNPANGDITLQMEVGFPANGRTINVNELGKILFDIVPMCVKEILYQKAYSKKELSDVAELAEDQQYIRQELLKLGLVAFVANGAILPRKSGVSMLPMKDAVPFKSPESMEVSLDLPNRGLIKGMGIKRGVTLIVGGGYHGKSTLLKALELGVYNHIAGDGREYVITDSTAMKLRAEDGRCVKKTDISMFIRNLPNGKDTVEFSTEDASGSTSQAANVVEAIEAGSRLFLIDEDTSATNFMIRDELMQRVVLRNEEPIIPYIDRIREMYEEKGISTILVAGSSGSYFHKADCILQMKQYVPKEITAFAKNEAEKFPIVEMTEEKPEMPLFRRIVKKDTGLAGNQRVKMKTAGTEGLSIEKEYIDLRLVEQIVDTEQVNTLAHIILYLIQNEFDGKKTLKDAIDKLYMRIEKDGFHSFCTCGSKVPGGLAMPRKQEIFAAINRCRGYAGIQ
ncbi:MAG: ABC-ATPase domain-containing protein [Coprococcus sp.]